MKHIAFICLGVILCWSQGLCHDRLHKVSDDFTEPLTPIPKNPQYDTLKAVTGWGKLTLTLHIEHHQCLELANLLKTGMTIEQYQAQIDQHAQWRKEQQDELKIMRKQHCTSQSGTDKDGHPFLTSSCDGYALRMSSVVYSPRDGEFVAYDPIYGRETKHDGSDIEVAECLPEGVD